MLIQPDYRGSIALSHGYMNGFAAGVACEGSENVLQCGILRSCTQSWHFTESHLLIKARNHGNSPKVLSSRLNLTSSPLTSDPITRQDRMVDSPSQTTPGFVSNEEAAKAPAGVVLPPKEIRGKSSQSPVTIITSLMKSRKTIGCR